jgi:uncharacterized protein YbjT (DUF2867 family)
MISEQSSEKRVIQSKPYNILVTGSTGFIGSRLVKKLTSYGYTITALSRRKIPNTEHVRYVKADVLKEEELVKALQGIEVAYYLLHSMEGDKKLWKDFAQREKIQAQNFLKAATSAGVKRIIYLGGLINESLELSQHMQSRKDVGDILASGNIPVTQLRASIIIGAGGGSYAMLRYLVERLPLMVCPKWIKSLAQPIAVDDVIEYLVGCMEHSETSGKIFDIGGPEQLTYERLMRVYATFLNRNLIVIEIPFLTTRLSSYWVDLITPVKASLARPLIDSLIHDTVVRDDSITRIIPLKLKSVKDAIEIATKEMSENPPPEERTETKTSFIFNQKLLMVSLVAMLIVGTTYYWLDDRRDVYQPLWLVASGFWFMTIIVAILFVNKKTRLGYMIGGLLAWVTLAFWLFDNYALVFHKSLIAVQPNSDMAIRNFIGVIIAGIAISASHNVFHKIRSHQNRGRPA